MPDPNVPLNESTWRRISAALIETQNEIHRAIDASHDRLRQRLQVIAVDEATPAADEETEQ